MATACFPIRSALRFQLLLNVGAILGAIVGSIIADRVGARPVVTAMFLIATVCISLLGVVMPAGALYSIVLVAGVGATGTQIVLFGYVATHFAAHLRARSLGVTTSFARLGGVAGPTLGAYLITSSLGLFWSFGTFATFALVGAVAAASVPTLIRAQKPVAGAQSVSIA
jgi:MFS transporter, AAHS family, benzoate transport protein